MIDTINDATAKYAKQKRGIESLQDGHDLTIVGMQVIGSAHPVAGAATTIVGKILTDKVNGAIKAETASVEKQYDEAIGLAVQAAVANAGEDIRTEWTNRKLTDKDAAEAMNALIGQDQADFFNKFALAGLPKEAKTDIVNAKADIVMKALSRYAAHSGAQRQADLDEVRSSLGKNAEEIRKVATDVVVFREQVATQMDNLETVFNNKIEVVSAELSAVQGDVNAIQAQMWRGMSPQQQLAALNDGFMRTMPAEQKQTLQASLENTVSILNTRDAVLDKLQAAGKIGNFLATVGVPIDAENLQKNINTASSAINVVSNIALGNWFGAFESAGGLFGGGGASDNGSKAVMAKLQQVIELQQQALKKLDALSQQLSQSTNAILAKLDGISLTVEQIASIQKEDQFYSKLTGCRGFVEAAQRIDYGMTNGVFGSYRKRAAHFDYDNGPEGYGYYRNCRQIINELKNIEPGASGTGSQNVARSIFIEERIAGPKTYRVGPLYTRMLAVAMAGAVDSSPTCWNRTLAILSDAPDRFSNARLDRLACSSPTDTERALKAENMEAIDGNLALAKYLSVPSIRSIVGYAMFLAPYSALSFTTKDNQVRLRGLDDIAKRGKLINDADDDSIVWPKYYVDLLNIASAQQTVLSGIYAVPATEAILASTQYGKAADIKWKDPALVDVDHQCKSGALQADAVDPSSYPDVACLLRENPWYLSNTLRHLITKTLWSSKARISEYQFALASNDGTHIESLLPGLPLKWVAPTDKRPSPWVLTLKDAAGQEWQLELPSAAEIRSEVVAYRAGSDEIFKLRSQLQTKVILQSDSVQNLPTDETDGPLLNRAFMSDQSLGEATLLN